MGANPYANGGILLRDLRMPDFHDYAVNVPSPGTIGAAIRMRWGVSYATW
jgi:xylulose-5-phosphate/fructose-6-phosphate phosphoketolase